MVNTDDFIKRLEIILEYYSLNASSFADKIGVQRSSMSHLLSGRNKPSLDFILKIVDIFPDVDLYWILKGKGDFPKNLDNDEKLNTTIISEQILDTPTPTDLFSQIHTPIENKFVPEKAKQVTNTSEIENDDEIDKIVFFYKNGTFKIYNPN